MAPDWVIPLVLVVILVTFGLGVLLYLRRRLKERREKLLGELRDRPELIRDRAFNRLAMARREADLLGQQGVDVSRPRALISESQGAFDNRGYDRAYELAQQAHEALVHARQDRVPLASAPTAASPSTAPSPSGVPPAPVSTAPPSPAPSIPKNRAESQFQMRLLDTELDAARNDPARSAACSEASRFRADAGTAFDRGDFTDAFRLALKGRRAIGAPVESLPATPGAAGPASGANRAPVDPARSAEETASAERCPSCGYPLLAGDAFCRGCGEPRSDPMTCPQCGAARQSSDGFCGRCGTSFA